MVFQVKTMSRGALTSASRRVLTRPSRRTIPSHSIQLEMVRTTVPLKKRVGQKPIRKHRGQNLVSSSNSMMNKILPPPPAFMDRPDPFVAATIAARKLLLKAGQGRISEVRYKLRRFRREIKGLPAYRQILFNYLNEARSGKVCPKTYLAHTASLSVNRRLFGDKAIAFDPVVEYLMEHHQDADVIPSTRVKSWLTASFDARMRMEFVPAQKKRVVKPATKINLAEQDASVKFAYKHGGKHHKNYGPRQFVDWSQVVAVHSCTPPPPVERKSFGELYAVCQLAKKCNRDTTLSRLADAYIGKMFERPAQTTRFATPQMENDDAHGEGSVSVDTTQNVQITTARDTSGEVIPRVGNWVTSVTEDTVTSIPEFLERWNAIKVVQWTTAQALDASVLNLALPVDVIHHTDNRGVISYVPFWSHQYWRGDMKIRVDLNVNKFAIGQLQVSFYYGYIHDTFGPLHNSVYNLSQCQHGILDAGGSNSVELVIPFKNQSVFVPTRTTYDSKPLYVGTLSVRVLAPLRIPEGNQQHCDLVVYLSLPNSEFTGQISRTISATPQMESAILMAGAMKLLDTVAADANRDNPPAIIPPAYVVPTASHSWATGTGDVEPLHMLRLDPSGQTHHPTGVALDQHSSIMDVMSIFSLIKQFQWSTSTQERTLLYKTLVDPTDFTGAEDNDKLSLFSLSPLQVMSSCFAQWRGSIEFRFDFVTSAFHTGRVMVAFIPNARDIDAAKLTYDVCKSSFHSVFDLREARSFTFVAPYVNRDPWIRRKKNMSGDDVIYSPCGKLMMFTVCALSCPATVSTTIDINVYVRAGPSFELSIPIQPSIGLGYSTSMATWNYDVLFPKAGMTPVYIGTWDGYYGNNELVVRWGTIAGRVAEFPELQYYYDDRHNNSPMYWESSEKLFFPNKKSFVKYFVASNDGGIYSLFAAKSKSDAATAWKLQRAGNNDWKKHLETANVSGAWTTDAIHFNRRTLQASQQMERMNPNQKLGATDRLASTDFGRSLYGESFFRLKDLCRRYQFYGRKHISGQTAKRISIAMVKFPVYPVGLQLDIGTKERPNYTANKCREGMIPLILSGFKYFRGSIRFRIILPPALSSYVWIQHRPDVAHVEPKMLDATEDDDECCMLAHGYAMYLQHTAVNGIIEFEVPFYQTGMYGLLGYSKNQNDYPYTNLGLVILGVSGAAGIPDCDIDVFYCLGDDFNFNTFQGFPMMVDASQVAASPIFAPTTITVESLSSSFEELSNDIPQGQTLTMSTSTDRHGSSQMMKSVVDYFTAPVQAQIREGITDAVGEVQRTISAASEQVKTANYSGEAKQFIVNLISNLAHIAQNFTPGAIATAVISVLAGLGLKLYEYTQIVIKFVSLIVSKFGFSGTQHHSPDGVVNLESIGVTIVDSRKATAQGPTDDDSIICEWVSAFYSACCMAMGIASTDKMDGPPLKKWSKFMSKDFGDSLRTGNALLSFIKSHMTLFSRVSNWVLGRLNPDVYTMALFSGKDPAIKLWFDEATTLCNIDWQRQPHHNDRYIDRLVVCELVGREFLKNFVQLDSRRGTHMAVFVERYYEKIRKLMSESIDLGLYPYARIKPLHIQFFGDAGIGKSELIRQTLKYVLTEVCGEDLKKVGPNYACTVTGSDRFWNNCNGRQPGVIIDDMWAVSTPNALEAQLITYFELYGTQVFCPPQAVAEKKAMRYCPKVVVSTTNYPQPVFPGVHKEALKRRRDVLIEVQPAPLDPTGHPACPHCLGQGLEITPKSSLADNHHQIYYINKRIGDAGNDHQDRITPAMTWPQLQKYLLDHLIPRWQKNRDSYLDDIAEFSDVSYATDEVVSLTDRIEAARDAYTTRLNTEDRSWFSEWDEGYLASARAHTTNYWSKLRENTSNMFSTVARFATVSDILVSEDAEGVAQAGGEHLMYRPNESCDKYVTERARDYVKFKDLMRENNRDVTNSEFNTFEVFGMLARLGCAHAKLGIVNVSCVGDSLCGPDFTMVPLGECDHCIVRAHWRDFFNEAWLNDASNARHLQEGNQSRILPWLRRSTVAKTVDDVMEVIRRQMGNMYTTCFGENSLFAKALSFCKTFLSTIKSFIRDWWQIIAPVTIAIGAGLTWYYTRKDSETEETCTSQSKPYNQQIQRVAKARVPRLASAKPQSAYSQQSSAAERAVRRNSAYLECTYVDDCGQSRTIKFMCLVMYERQLLMQRHYWETIQAMPTDHICKFRWVEDRHRILNAPDTGIRVNILDCNHSFYEYEQGARDSNFMLVELPKFIDSSKSLVSFIAPASRHAHIGTRALFVRPGSSTHMVALKRDLVGLTIGGLKDNRFSGPIVLDMSYEYEMSAPGYCGSVLLDPSLETPIIGMHVAGLDGTTTGISELLTAEMFPTKPSRKQPVVDICEMELEPVDISQINIDTVIYPKGFVDKKLGINQSPETQYTKSAIAGRIMPILTEPMPLSAKDPRINGVDPLNAGCNKHGMASRQFPAKLIRQVGEHYGDKILAYAKPLRSEIGVLSLNEAICGVVGMPEYGSLEWTTSAGFPLVKLQPPGVRGKKWLFNLEETQDGFNLLGINPILKDRLEVQQALRENGVRNDVVFTCCCKDICASMEKCRIPGKTRVFETAPVDYVIAFRRYFGDFLAAMKKNRFDLEHAVGINVDSYEWATLHKRLSKFGPKIIAGDYGSFGYTLNSDIIAQAFDIMLRWYDTYSNSKTLERDQIVRGVIAAESINVKRLARTLVYESQCGIASGFPATDIMNTMVNCMYIRCAWVETVQRPLSEMDTNVQIYTYGDDLIMNVSDKFVDQFDSVVLRDYFASYDIKFTDIDKLGEMVPTRTLENAPFLKRNFKPHPHRPGMWLAPIDEMSIGGALNWIHKKDDPIAATLVNVQAALNLAYGHGPVYYDKLRRNIIEVTRELGVVPSLKTWMEMDNDIYASSYVKV